MAGRGGVAHRPEPGRLILVHQALLAQRERIRIRRQRMQMLPLGGQPLLGDRRAFPLDPAVDPPAPLACCFVTVSSVTDPRGRGLAADYGVTTTNFRRFGGTLGTSPGQRTIAGTDNGCRAC